MTSKRQKRIEYYLAWGILVGCTIAWPISLFTFASEEPPAVLSLSWGAMIFTAWDIIKTSRVDKENGSDE